MLAETGSWRNSTARFHLDRPFAAARAGCSVIRDLRRRFWRHSCRSEAISRQLRHAGHDDSGTDARTQTGGKRDASKPSTRVPCRLGQYRTGKAGQRVAVSMGGARGATMAAGYAGSETLHQIPCGSACHWCGTQPLSLLLQTW
jgi:hypothetical protein